MSASETTTETVTGTEAGAQATAPATDVASIVEWCRGYLADLLDTAPAEIDPAADFDRLGVDSALAVSLLIEVEERYGVDIAPEELFENPTIAAVAEYLHTRAS